MSYNKPIFACIYTKIINNKLIIHKLYCMPKYKTALLLAIIIFSIFGCSRKKNKFVNRNFHAMTTYYNILYHGNIEIAKGIDQVKQSVPDHYFDILPVERMAIVPPDRNDTVPLNEFFGNAELKATKGIQKHSMFMGGREYNFQVDEAYLLLGIARYYDQRFIPAKDAFNFIINHYPNSEIITKAETWLQKTNMRLNYDEVALENLQKILRETPQLLPEDAVEVYASIAAILIKLNQYEDAIIPITEAANLVETAEEKARWNYIKGQLYNQIGVRDSANASFQQVIDLKRKPPRDYMVHSFMEIFKNEDYNAEDTPYVKSYFQELHEDWENRNFLDYLFFESAQHFLKIDSIDLAIDYYNKSLRKDPKSQYLKSRDYLNLANIYFDKASYKTAGFYYDSTMTNLDQSTREYRLIRKKRTNLDEVIKYEDVATETDSILDLVEMDDKTKYAFFENYTNQLKEEAKSLFAQQKQEERMANVAAPQIGGFGSASSAGNSTNAQDFYFYNQNKLSSGKNKFKRVWGDIALADNWRLKGRKASNTNDQEEEENTEEEIFEDPRFDPETYIAQLPTEEKVIDSIADQRAYAYFQLGVIYKEKFKENELAIQRFTKLLQFEKTDKKLILPTKYNLYLAYKNLEDTTNAELWKQKIIQEHPNSRYAELLLNPRSLRDGENSPSKIYARLYTQFQNQQLNGLLEETEHFINEFTGMPIQPKFKLLRAQIKARLYGIDVYKEELDLVALDHPQTKEGKKAKELLDNLKGSMGNASFKPSNAESEFKLVYFFESDTYTDKNLQEIMQNMKEGLALLGYESIKLSKEAYNIDYHFIIIYGLQSKLGSEGMAELLLENKVTLSDWNYFSITKENYSILQIHKNLEKYLEIQ